MTTEEIEVLFHSVIEEKAIYKNLIGISEDKIYNWRKGRGAKPSVGDMLGVLYQLNKISVFNCVIKSMPNKIFSSTFDEPSGYTHTLHFDPNK
ncbi:hypothetical protein [Flavobacterium granuli]|uniref:Transcriptional regulator n=1 Tax=Flavobacterium granuli TaxID=280093 RepID=A0ABU1S1K3_9FLAO|nr:hypothetical protein [Flavobacterium granuli]MDR6844530.1 hypothetical protein [Flavobacterium granuli]